MSLAKSAAYQQCYEAPVNTTLVVANFYNFSRDDDAKHAETVYVGSRASCFSRDSNIFFACFSGIFSRVLCSLWAIRMGKADFLSPKAISNRIKSKGLQKLRWYCQMCQKQCRDEVKCSGSLCCLLYLFIQVLALTY